MSGWLPWPPNWPPAPSRSPPSGPTSPPPWTSGWLRSPCPPPAPPSHRPTSDIDFDHINAHDEIDVVEDVYIVLHLHQLGNILLTAFIMRMEMIAMLMPCWGWGWSWQWGWWEWGWSWQWGWWGWGWSWRSRPLRRPPPCTSLQLPILCNQPTPDKYYLIYCYHSRSWQWLEGHKVLQIKRLRIGSPNLVG